MSSLECPPIEGYNRSMAPNSMRGKRSLPSIAARNRVFGNIVRALAEKESFLMIGHANPDEDCLGSLAAFGLLARKLGKRAAIYMKRPFPRQFSFLTGICSFNGIRVLTGETLPEEPFDAAVALDTPKPSMLDIPDRVRAALDSGDVLKIELDHHLETDAEYFGDEGFCLVTDASSTCELVGFLAYKIDADAALKERFGLAEVFTRNLVLAIITGVIGDSRMGMYLKTTRERRLYGWMSGQFDRMLEEKTHSGSENFKSKEHVFEAMASLTHDEEYCRERISARRRHERLFDWSAVPEAEARELRRAYGDETFVSVVKSVVDDLAEQNGTCGLVAYTDDALAQFRIRRARGFTGFDLRDMLAELSFENGGGHPGAIGFRLPKGEVPDLDAFCADLVERVTAMIERRRS